MSAPGSQSASKCGLWRLSGGVAQNVVVPASRLADPGHPGSPGVLAGLWAAFLLVEQLEGAGDREWGQETCFRVSWPRKGLCGADRSGWTCLRWCGGAWRPQGHPPLISEMHTEPAGSMRESQGSVVRGGGAVSTWMETRAPEPLRDTRRGRVQDGVTG